MQNAKLLIICIAAVTAITSCDYRKNHNHIAESAENCIDSNFLSSLEFSKATMAKLMEEIPMTGAVEPDPDNVVEFVSLVSGIVSNAKFSLGDKVYKGQVLAELHSTELSALQSQLNNIHSQINVAEKKLESAEAMYKDGISSQKDLMEARSELDILSSEKRKVSSDLKLFSASADKGVFLIRSPASGIITSKSITGGTQISAGGDPLFTVADLDQVWVLVNVYATNVQNVQPGMEVKITSLSYPGEVFAGKVHSVSQVYDREARVLKAKVVMPNKGLKLKPGMLVDVTALRHRDAEAISIPTEALVFDDDQDFVVVYKNNCDIEIRKVGVFLKTNGTTYLRDGLREGETIITRNPLLVYEQIKNFQK